jgi:hypothetical protein
MSYLIQFVLKDAELLVGEGNPVYTVYLGSQQGTVHAGLQLPLLIEEEFFIHHLGLPLWRAGPLCRGRQESGAACSIQPLLPPMPLGQMGQFCPLCEVHLTN